MSAQGCQSVRLRSGLTLSEQSESKGQRAGVRRGGLVPRALVSAGLLAGGTWLAAPRAEAFTPTPGSHGCQAVEEWGLGPEGLFRMPRVSTRGVGVHPSRSSLPIAPPDFHAHPRTG